MTTVLALALPCPRCKADTGEPCVNRDGSPASRSHVRRAPLAPCGTDGGYQRHRKADEEPCDECREANRRKMQAYRERRPEVRAADIAALRARREAVKRLIEQHRADFDRLLAEARGTAS